MSGAPESEKLQPKLYNKVDVLEKIIASHDQLIKNCQEGIEKVFDRIEKLEQTRETDYKMWKESVVNKLTKKPFICPVCDGRSKTQVFDSQFPVFAQVIIDEAGRYFISCNPCQGKGIVWSE